MKSAVVLFLVGLVFLSGCIEKIENFSNAPEDTSPVKIACYNNSGCGNDAYVREPYCIGGNVAWDFETHYCENPGKNDSMCYDFVKTHVIEECGDNYMCINGSCVKSTCSDGIQNQNETGVDCGGPCLACPNCSDGIQNQNETGVDCGGPCALCQCFNGVHDPNEIGVDCGGFCPQCPSCFDKVKNQNETDMDCGGNCNKCPVGMVCRSSSDCATNYCNYDGICAAPSCSDGISNGFETGTDCGGPCKKCPACYFDFECGQESALGDEYCESGHITRKFIKPVCAWSGKENAVCNNATIVKTWDTAC